MTSKTNKSLTQAIMTHTVLFHGLCCTFEWFEDASLLEILARGATSFIPSRSMIGRDRTYVGNRNHLFRLQKLFYNSFSEYSDFICSEAFWVKQFYLFRNILSGTVGSVPEHKKWIIIHHKLEFGRRNMFKSQTSIDLTSSEKAFLVSFILKPLHSKVCNKVLS